MISFNDGNPWNWTETGGTSIGTQPAGGNVTWTSAPQIPGNYQVVIDKVPPSPLTGSLGAPTMNYYAGSASGSQLSFTVTKPVKLVSCDAGCFRTDGGCPAQGQYFTGDLVFTGPSGQNVPVQIVSTNASAGEEEEVIVCGS